MRSAPRPELRASGGYRLLDGRFVTTGRREWLRAGLSLAGLFGPGVLALRVASSVGSRRWARRAERWWAAAARTALGLRLDASGLEHVDPRCRYVVVALHESFVDALMLSCLPLSLTAVARDELGHAPFLGRQLRAGGHVLVAPERPLAGTRHLVAAARTALTDGDSVLVFPQGSILGLEIAFQPGAFALAARLGVPLLPVVVTGGHRAWGYPFTGDVRFGERVSLRVLPPVPAADAWPQRRAIEAAMKATAVAPGTAPARRFVPARDGFWDGYRYEIDDAHPDLARLVAERRARLGTASERGRT